MKIKISSHLKLKKGISRVEKIKEASKQIYQANIEALSEEGISEKQFVNRITSDVIGSKSYSMKSLKENVKVYNNIINLGDMSGLSWSDMDDEMRRDLIKTMAPSPSKPIRYRDYITGRFITKEVWEERWGSKELVEVDDKNIRLLDDETGELYSVPISELNKFKKDEEKGFDYATAEYVGHGSDGAHENYEILQDAEGHLAFHYYSRGTIVPYE